MPIDFKDVVVAQDSDELISQVKSYVLNEWPTQAPHFSVGSFHARRTELSILDSCLMFRGRPVIPKLLQPQVLKALHLAHPGIVRMKALARQYAYWPGIDHDITHLVRSCDECQSAAKMPPKQPLRPWPTPGSVFGRIHIDFAGPCSDGNTYLVIVDAYSKWPEVIRMSSTTTSLTIQALQKIMDRYGYPLELVSDNGTQFTSKDFSDFCTKNKIKHSLTPAYHPQSNGLCGYFQTTNEEIRKRS